MPADQPDFLTTVLTTLLVVGPFAMLGAFGILRTARMVTRLVLRGKLLASLGLAIIISVLGAFGLLGATVSVDTILETLNQMSG